MGQVIAHHPDFPTEDEVEEVGVHEAFAPFQKMLQFALEPLLLAGASLPVPEPPGLGSPSTITCLHAAGPAVCCAMACRTLWWLKCCHCCTSVKVC